MSSKVLDGAERRKPPNAGKGRVKGVPNKVTGELKEMILQALDGAGGVKYLQRQADASPTAFLSLVGKVLPLQVNASGDMRIEVVVGGYHRADDR
jgi:hypothetical protein